MNEVKIKHPETPGLLRLHACDQQDLQVVSAMLQDSLVTLSDMVYWAEEKRFAILFNRFCWETHCSATKAAKEKPGQRIHTGCIFNDIEQVQQQGLDESSPSQILNLLAVEWHEDKKSIHLIFSNNMAVKLSTPKVNCYLKDLGDSWPTCWQPQHQA
ncbi:MAG TPA: DUF2948 family protein [Alphaproteobacteria bacterium]|nr:DUF2948 family protein [Alphaproteobacteria bacterium]